MAFYLFPGVMYARFKKTNQEHAAFYKTYTPMSLRSAYQTYNLFSKQYLGFGSLLQFIPGTNANNARQALSNELNPVMDKMIAKLAKISARQYGDFFPFKKYAYRFPLYSYLNIGPVFKFLDDVAAGFDKSGIKNNKKYPLIRLIFRFPILNDIFYVNEYRKIKFDDNALRNVIHTVLNPLRLIDASLNFIQLGVNRILDIGSERGTPSSSPRVLLKGIAGLTFGVVKLPVKALKHTIDLILEVVKVLTIDPLVHIGSSIKSLYQRNKEKLLSEEKRELTIRVGQLHAVKQLRREAKERVNTSYTAITKATGFATEYIGISKEELYTNRFIEQGRQVTIRGTVKKIEQTEKLLSLINFFNENPEVERESIVNTAKVTLAF